MNWVGIHPAALLVCSAMLSSACVNSTEPPESEGAGSRSGDARTVSTAPLAELVGFEEIASGVLLRVITTGCTRAEDFELVVERVEDNRVQLTVLRTRLDDCRRMPATKNLEFSRASMGLEDEEIILMNPLVALPGRG